MDTPLQPQSVATVTAEVSATPVHTYLQAIQQELSNDPMKLGYAGKTPQQQADLMNSPYTILVPQVQTARIAQIINQIPFAPNITSSTDIMTALGG